jgi:hypothetical protein
MGNKNVKATVRTPKKKTTYYDIARGTKPINRPK